MAIFVKNRSKIHFFRDANVLDCCWWVEKLKILKSVWKMQNKLSRTAQCRITRLDKYEMLETVGEGAYGIVWKARNRGKVPYFTSRLVKSLFYGGWDNCNFRNWRNCRH